MNVAVKGGGSTKVVKCFILSGKGIRDFRQARIIYRQQSSKPDDSASQFFVSFYFVGYTKPVSLSFVLIGLTSIVADGTYSNSGLSFAILMASSISLAKT